MYGTAMMPQAQPAKPTQGGIAPMLTSPSQHKKLPLIPPKTSYLYQKTTTMAKKMLRFD